MQSKVDYCLFICGAQLRPFLKPHRYESIKRPVDIMPCFPFCTAGYGGFEEISGCD